ncbi:MAG: methyltransferase domain-containing protein [Deltaproteobacteria bacterium]|nr:methyltransferase domain-containing protein [Deltaproteobacteria bacterium]MCL5276407.1 methyltransferase domain-containing protein [Deltaproteobacteria bacterium]
MHKFDPTRAHDLDNPQRREHEQPDKILSAAGIKQGMVVADVGCGTGFYTMSASALTGKDGLVYAVDISKDMLDMLKKKIESHSIRNVYPVVSEETGIPLGDGIADMVINVNMLHEAYDRETFLQELRRLMKPDGRLVLIDHRREPTPSGPPLEDRVSYEDAFSLLKRYFDVVVKGPSGEYQYGFIAMK